MSESAMPSRQTMAVSRGPTIRMGVTIDGAAWVTVWDDHRSGTYRVERRPPDRSEYGERGYHIVAVPHASEPTLPALTVVQCAHDAFLDAYGAV